ncbi:MAG: hypothetical protein HZC55_18255 [Verrucomicrobia bacterium]|nr:hypothetical protein [Verrucomicrobiota bacterium]
MTPSTIRKHFAYLAASMLAAVTGIAAPSEGVLKQWLHDKEAVVEPRWWWLDKTLKLKGYSITDLKVEKCEESTKLQPWKQNIGTVWVAFTYREGTSSLNFDAVLTYTYEGALVRNEYLESVIIKRR